MGLIRAGMFPSELENRGKRARELRVHKRSGYRENGRILAGEGNEKGGAGEWTWVRWKNQRPPGG